MNQHLPTEPYKGTRDFYPEDMGIQRYIFDTWARVAESFGYERVDASLLEPAELYKAKGAENEELVNEQTYTFIDRGEREVTLRPEMTPSVARMVAAKRRELSFPVRWYSIPNLFRYERPQRGRLREHWQLNCDLFGITSEAGDIELITLAANVIRAFGATDDMFTIHVNDRSLMHTWYNTFGLSEDTVRNVTRLVDRRRKMSADEFRSALSELVSDPDAVIRGLDAESPDTLVPDAPLSRIIDGLRDLGINNVIFDASIARGFDYYTGTVFEILDTAAENNRSILGGGRYDNLTSLFGDEPVPGIGFGMGDVVMRDFLLTHDLLPKGTLVTAPLLAVIPTDAAYDLESEKVASIFRTRGIRTSVDLSDRKVGKKVGVASDHGVRFILVVGADEAASGSYTLKNLATGEESSGSPEELASKLSSVG